jgi:hypothetical protein
MAKIKPTRKGVPGSRASGARAAPRELDRFGFRRGTVLGHPRDKREARSVAAIRYPVFIARAAPGIVGARQSEATLRLSRRRRTYALHVEAALSRMVVRIST